MPSRGSDGVGTASRPRVLLLGLLFILSRSVILPFPQPTSDVGIYAQYAYEHEAAARAGVPFYEFHARAVQKQIDAARAMGRLAGSMEEYKDVEYPPLAIAVIRLPGLWIRDDAGGAQAPLDFVRRYYVTYRLGLAVVDLLLFLLLLRLVPWLFPEESGREQTQRLLVYLISTVALGHLFYDRLDLLLTLLMVLALTLLLSRWHYGWSFAVLAVGIAFKLAPAVLAPVWILGALPVAMGGSFVRPRAVVALGSRTVLLVGMVLGCFLPFYLLSGEQSLRFLAYHRGRGLEVGSMYSSVPLAMQALGLPVTLNYSYGSINVSSPVADGLVALAPWLAVGVLLAASVWILLHFQRVTASATATSRRTLAQVYPRHIVGYALLMLMLFIVTNKVFSPQYLLWLAPLVCLAPISGARRTLLLWGFILVCAASTILVPFWFTSDLLDPTAPEVVPRALVGPTARVSVLIVARNLLFLLLTAGTALAVLGERSQLPTAQPPQD